VWFVGVFFFEGEGGVLGGFLMVKKERVGGMWYDGKRAEGWRKEIASKNIGDKKDCGGVAGRRGFFVR